MKAYEKRFGLSQGDSTNSEAPPQCLGFHFCKRENAGTTESMRFGFSPNSFAWIQFRTIRRKQIQAKLSFIAPNLLRHLIGLVHRVTIPYQKHRRLTAGNQAIQKAANHICIQPLFLNHEPHPAASIDGADHVKAISRTGAAHHGGFPLESPGGSA